MTVFSPDGRAWSVIRRPATPGFGASLLPGGSWVVEADRGDRVRRWPARSRRAAGRQIVEVALALRTGAPGPEGELLGADGDIPAAAEGSRSGDTLEPTVS